MTNDNVNHPKHYAGSTSLECIEAMEMAFGEQAVYDFCICNSFKYLWRYKNKNGAEDINKAEWYIKKAEEIRKEVNKQKGWDYIELVNEDSIERMIEKARFAWLKDNPDKTD